MDTWKFPHLLSLVQNFNRPLPTLTMQQFWSKWNKYLHSSVRGKAPTEMKLIGYILCPVLVKHFLNRVTHTQGHTDTDTHSITRILAQQSWLAQTCGISRRCSKQNLNVALTLTDTESDIIGDMKVWHGAFGQKPVRWVVTKTQEKTIYSDLPESLYVQERGQVFTIWLHDTFCSCAWPSFVARCMVLW